MARFGPSWYQGAGTADAPGSTLLTLAGDVRTPGLVVELLRPVTFGELLAGPGGLPEPPRAILIGGYTGTWVDGQGAWTVPIDRLLLNERGAPLGCGIVAALGHGRCGLAETARLTAWLSDESAGQCGPCAQGMPALASTLADVASGRATHSRLIRIHDLSDSIVGRGLCHLPDGAAMLVQSALETFQPELRDHGLVRRCSRSHDWAASPLPLPGARHR